MLTSINKHNVNDCNNKIDKFHVSFFDLTTHLPKTIHPFIKHIIIITAPIQIPIAPKININCSVEDICIKSSTPIGSISTTTATINPTIKQINKTIADANVTALLICLLFISAYLQVLQKVQ